MDTESLYAQLRDCLGSDRVITDSERRRLLSTDFYQAGSLCAVAIRPANAAALAAAVNAATGAGLAVIPRGGGMSYTGGYTPDTERCVIVDLTDLEGIVAFSRDDMTITVRAGTTWETIYDSLKTEGLRLPFFGTFSGRAATVGGGLSNGAVFLGTARYGAAADNVLGLEVVCADGTIVRTGQAAFRNGKPFLRTYGPDLTGLFLHDCGTLGIKTEATFRLIETPRHTDHLSFALADALTAAGALSAVARSGAAEDAYVFDPATTAKNMAGGSLRSDARRLRDIVTGQGSLAEGLRAGARVVAAGRDVVPDKAYSLHITCAGRERASVQADLAHCRTLLAEHGGREIPNSIPIAVRATPFDNLNGVLDAGGHRWVALNAKVPHSDAGRIIRAFEELIAEHRDAMRACEVNVSTLFIAMGTHAFSFEPVFHWPDRWLPMHRTTPDPDFIAGLVEPDTNPAGATLVAELRAATLELFEQLGAASNQIGRTYRYRENLNSATRDLLDALKQAVDRDGMMNPGALGFPSDLSA